MEKERKIALPDFSTMYQALVNRDVSFEGIFIVGVKTTGIFCRPSCRARKPKKENVEFFQNVKQALSFGYRPCRVCYPLKPMGKEPDWLSALLKDIADSPDAQFKDQDIRNRGLDPVRVRRWFNQNHGMTFQAFLRATRINRAVGLIKNFYCSIGYCRD